MVLLLEATRRALGPTIMIVAIVFLGYTFLGSFAPGFLAWKGASFGAVSDHQWFSSEGIFGIALGVSTKLVFLFVLFSALLDKAGAGNYFIKVAFSLMGHMRGGPAKVAVLASGMTGLISGSSIANVVTTSTSPSGRNGSVINLSLPLSLWSKHYWKTALPRIMAPSSMVNLTCAGLSITE